MVEVIHVAVVARIFAPEALEQICEMKAAAQGHFEKKMLLKKLQKNDVNIAKTSFWQEGRFVVMEN